MSYEAAIAQLKQMGLLQKREQPNPKRSSRKPGQFSPEYLAYMDSPQWQQKRQQRLVMDDFKCQTCNATARLQVHHKTYKNCDRLGFGNEPLEDLITLCAPCHKAITVSMRRRKRRVKTR